MCWQITNTMFPYLLLRPGLSITPHPPSPSILHNICFVVVMLHHMDCQMVTRVFIRIPLPVTPVKSMLATYIGPTSPE